MGKCVSRSSLALASLGVKVRPLDWASRSEDGKASKEAFQGKRFALASASPGKKGGAGGLNHLRDVIEDIRGVVIEKQVSVPQAYQLLDSVEHFENSPYYSELTHCERFSFRH